MTSTDDGSGTAVVTRHVEAPPAVVWQVLCDGWTFAVWVVGTSRIRRVDPDWPRPGSRIHHSVGLWPALLNDHTEVRSAQPEQQLVLRARAWPAGEADVDITLDPDGPTATRVAIREDVTGGPASLIPKRIRQPLIVPRNTESLRRLAMLAEGRHAGGITGEGAGPTASG